MKPVTLAFGFILACFLMVAGFITQPPRPLSTEVYVWQREASPALRSALERSQGLASRRHFLAVEIGRINGVWHASRTKLPDELLRGNGLVIRIGSSLSGETWHSGEILDKVMEEIAWAAAKPVTDFQIDYDSPQRSLGNYLRLLNAIKKAHPGKTWSITALPSWMDTPDAKQLFTTADGIVMQLHSLKLPAKPEMPVILCDPVAARDTARKMSELGIPYHIALNTYGCEVWFDRNNRVIDVISEDVESPTPAAATRRSMGISDAVQLATLVREWKQNPPSGMRGIVWYRLPIETDRRNWKWTTWQRVASGEMPTPDLRIEVKRSESGAWDIILANRGERDERLPEIIDTGCEALVLEGLNGYAPGIRDQLRLEKAPWPWLAPGKSFSMGWLRTSDPSAFPKPTFGKQP